MSEALEHTRPLAVDHFVTALMDNPGKAQQIDFHEEGLYLRSTLWVFEGFDTYKFKRQTVTSGLPTTWVEYEGRAVLQQVEADLRAAGYLKVIK